MSTHFNPKQAKEGLKDHNSGSEFERNFGRSHNILFTNLELDKDKIQI
jgi:hypothetical protein